MAKENCDVMWPYFIQAASPSRGLSLMDTLTFSSASSTDDRGRRAGMGWAISLLSKGNISGSTSI